MASAALPYINVRVLTDAVKAAGPPLLFGLRLWASVCLALYVAFWLELDNPYWAGTTAALVCQPQLGASLRNGWYRIIGTVVGGVVIVLLTACFAQDRSWFLLSLALWGAACAFVATLMPSFLAFSPALAGITAAIIASDELGATGGANGQAFMLAVTRASEICIGVVCARIILAGTDFRHRAAPGCGAIRRPFGRDRRQIRTDVVACRPRTARDAADTARARPARNRTRSGH